MFYFRFHFASPSVDQQVLFSEESFNWIIFLNIFASEGLGSKSFRLGDFVSLSVDWQILSRVSTGLYQKSFQSEGPCTLGVVFLGESIANRQWKHTQWQRGEEGKKSEDYFFSAPALKFSKVKMWILDLWPIRIDAGWSMVVTWKPCLILSMRSDARLATWPIFSQWPHEVLQQQQQKKNPKQSRVPCPRLILIGCVLMCV